jgi:hypothetical protein
MEPSIVRTWETIIGQFTALKHLSIWGMPSSLLLRSICASDLQYIEFRRPWTHSYRDAPQLNELVSFLKECPSLCALKYHSAKPIEVIDELALTKGLKIIWGENYQIDGYMEDVSKRFYLFSRPLIKSKSPEIFMRPHTRRGEHSLLLLHLQK